MKSLTISLSNNTDFNKITIDNEVYKLSFNWENNISEQDKDWLLFKFRSVLSGILNKNSNIGILDLSGLNGLKESNFSFVNLEEIIFPDSVKSVYFYDSNSIRKVYAKGATSIYIHNVPNLAHIEFGHLLKEVTLYETGISHIELPANITLLPGAFKGCKKLETVVLNSETNLPPSTFEDCNNLHEVVLPNDLQMIEPRAFSGCTNLMYIRGGNSIKHIFPSAFEGCMNLKNIDCVNFYKFSDLSISDEYWLNKYYPFKPSPNMRKNINEFVSGLKEKDIENPEEYIADYYFCSMKLHNGIVLKYHSRINGWIVWSISDNHFYATRKRVSCGLKEGDIIRFEIENKVVVSLGEQLNIKNPIHYIELSSIRIIEKDNENGEYEDLLECFKPKTTLLDYYKEKVNNISGLDIPKIIDSYNIKERTWWQTYPGRDDSEFFERIATSSYSDVYMDMLLPPEKKESYWNGCKPWGYNADEETRRLQKAADEEAEEVRKKAREQYSFEAHICTLLEDFINKRRELENRIEATCHIKAAKDFLKYKDLKAGTDGEDYLKWLYNVTLKDILFN